MAKLIIVAAVHVGMALMDWKCSDRRSRLAMGISLLASFTLASMTLADWTPLNPWELVQALFEPVGTSFLKVGE